MIDWLLADLPDIAFKKLEVYTFASAANHFNNPLCSYEVEPRLPNGPSTGQNNNGKPRVLRHVEHYANSNDIISRWGVLHFTESAEHRNNRFIGRVFERKGSGHMLNQHYLDNMFAMDPSTGRVRDTNEFMETTVDIDDQMVMDREPATSSSKRTPIEQQRLATPDAFLSAVHNKIQRAKQKPVKELSRLWKYRNGGSPD